MIRLALIDDHLMFREGLKSIISNFKEMEVVLNCENGKEFLDQLEVGVDIALMDLEMPEFNGLQTMETLHSLKSDIKVIFVSQNKEPSVICNLMELGARGYLVKDSKPGELEDAIHSVFETGYYFNEIVSQSMLMQLANKESVNPKFKQAGKITDREKEILTLICNEMTTSEISEKLFLSPKTVENHRSSIMTKTGARNSAGLVVYAIKNNIVHVG